MLKIAFCFAVVIALTLLSELLNKKDILNAEDRRKFFHITLGVFSAFLPWIISWQAIQVISVTMLVVVEANRLHPIFRFGYHVRRLTYGEYFYTLAIFLCATLTHNKIFFALAILNMALADGMAAVIGKNYGGRHKYKIFGQTKTVLGTMTFWFVSLLIFGVGLLFAHTYFGYHQYLYLLVFLPPTLALLENFAVYGLDNLVIPLTVILALTAI